MSDDTLGHKFYGIGDDDIRRILGLCEAGIHPLVTYSASREKMDQAAAAKRVEAFKEIREILGAYNLSL